MNGPSSDKVRDGTLKGCLGKDCPTSCCNAKHAIKDNGIDKVKVDLTTPSIYEGIEIPYTVTGPAHTYRAGLFPHEGGLISALHKDVKVEEVKLVTGVRGEQITTELMTTLDDCLGDTGCKIPDNKPFMCKIFPFGMHPNDPLEIPRCPAAFAIAADADNVKHVLALREHAGLRNNQRYLAHLYMLLEKEGHTPERGFLQDEEYLNNL